MVFSKEKKYALVIVMIVAFVVGYIPGISDFTNQNVVRAAEKQSENGYEYHVKQDGTAIIDKYVGSDSVASIPAVLGGKNVTEIGEGAFKANTKLQVVKMPNSIVKVGDYAFSKCANIKRITFSSKLERIGKYAFSVCVSLVKIKLPYSLKYIDEGAFTRCEEADSVEFDSCGEAYKYSMLECIGDSSFADCSKLTNFLMNPELSDAGNLKEISENAFYNCQELSCVTFPKSLEIVGSDAFSYCGSLESITNISSLKKIGSEAFSNCNFVEDATVNVEVLEDKALAGLSVEGNIKLGDNVKEIKSNAFEGGSFDAIEIGKNVSKCDEDAFYRSGAKGYVVDSGNKILSTDADKNLYNKDKTELISYKKEEIDEITVADSVKIIGNGAFSNEVKCSKLELPSGLQKIEKNAFYESSVNNMTVPDTVNDIEEKAFFGMEELQEITLGKGITKIPDGAFESDGSLEKINGLERATYIGNDAFYNCFNLKEIYLGKDFSDYDKKAFRSSTIEKFHVDDDNKKFCDYDDDLYTADKKELVAIHKLNFDKDSYTVKKGVEVIGSYAGYGMNVEEKIVVPDGVKEIKEAAFLDTSPCEEFKLPASVESIGKNAVGYCTIYKNLETLENFYINAPDGSCAQKYADDNDLAHGDKEAKINKDEVTLKGNEKFQLKVDGMKSSCLVFAATDPTIASIDDNGVITGRKKGSTYVCAGEGSKYFKCKVNVTSDGEKYAQAFDASSYKELESEEIEAWEDDYLAYNKNASFSVKDNKAVNIFTSGNYTAIKACYPEGKEYVGRAISKYGNNYKRYKNIGDLATEELHRGPHVHTNTLVYSGVSTLDNHVKCKSTLHNLKKSIGEVHTFECFTSTSIKKTVSKGFEGDTTKAGLLYIYVPKDYSKGAYIAPYSDYEGEKEYLLSPGYKYKIIDAGVKVVASEGVMGTINYVPQRFMSILLVDEKKEAPAKPTATPTPTVKPTPAAKKTSVTKNSITYKVSGKVAVVSKAKKSIKKAKILDKVKIGTKTYKVTKIASNAFKKCKKLKTIIWGKNIKSVGKNAFYMVNSKVKFKVSAKYLSKAKKLLTKKTGFVKKTMKIQII